VEITSESFIKDYIESIDSESKLICGGLSYSSEKPLKTFRLRWKYGHTKEVVSLENRVRNPYKSFKTVNFLIKKDVFEAIHFDESITTYGHEDTWFGYQLKKAGIQIKHINNPVLHTQLETNKQFILKTEQSIENLIRINKMANDSEFTKEITLLHTYGNLKKVRIVFLVAILFKITKTTIRKLLVSGFANNNLFASYKLGFLTQRINKKS
jgi:GT2 family glycosyltransferase